jgi:large subunit ribosomal protein L25
MAEFVTLKTKPRSAFGTRAAGKLRRDGLVPAVLYGHKEANLSLVLPAADVEAAIKKGARVVDLEVDGKPEKARFRELQWDHLGKEILHADFMRVSADERVVVAVRIELRGVCPGIGEGGVVDQPIHNLNVECPVLAIPEMIRVNIDQLHLGDSIHVRQVTLPPNVIAKVDPEAIVVIVKAQKLEAEAAPAAAAAVGETAEPEVIGKKIEAEEETEE